MIPERADLHREGCYFRQLLLHPLHDQRGTIADIAITEASLEDAFLSLIN